jgi:hypothetical protein
LAAAKAARSQAAADRAVAETVEVRPGTAPDAKAMAGRSESEGAAQRENASAAAALGALAERPQTTAAEARAAAAAYRAHAQRHAGTDEADEARVRSIEALAAAWRMERREADRQLAEVEARAYLAGPGPRKDRVRALLARLAP